MASIKSQTSSEITSHTTLIARKCQERGNADGLFLREQSAERREGCATAVARRSRAQNHHNAPETRCRALLGARQCQEVCRNGAKQWALFAGIMSRAKDGPYNAVERGHSCSESPQCPRNQMPCVRPSVTVPGAVVWPGGLEFGPKAHFSCVC